MITSAIVLRATMHFIGAEKYRTFIISEASNVLGGKTILVHKPLELKTIPILNKAKIIIKDVEVKDREEFLKAKEIVLTISLVDFIFGKLTYKSLEINNLDLFLSINKDAQNNKTKNWSFLYNNENKRNKFFQIKDLQLNNSSLTYKDGDFNFNIQEADISLDLNDTDKIALNGTFSIKDSKYAINALKDFASNSLDMNLKEDGTDINVKGKVINQIDNFSLSGDLEVKLLKPSFVSRAVINAIPFMKGMQKDTLQDPVSIKGDLLLGSNNFQINNLIINSTKTNGTGNIKIAFADTRDFNLNLHFTQLDLSNWFNFGTDNFVNALAKNPANIDATANQQTQEQHSYINFDLIDDESINIVLNAKTIILKNSDINNFKFDFNTNTGFVNKGNLSFDIHDDQYSTSINLKNLNFQNVDNVHLLLGEFHNEGDNINNSLKILNLQDFIDLNGLQLNYNIHSKIIFSAKEISLFEIKGNIGNIGSINGSIASTHDNMSHFNFDLQLNNLSLSDFKLPLIQERGYSLLTKSNNEDYLSYFRWFRTLSASYRFKIALQNTQIKDENISSMLITSDLSPGIMDAEINIDSDFTKGIYKFELTATQLKPTILLSSNLEFVKLDKLLELSQYFFNTDNTEQTTKTFLQEQSLNFWSDKKLNIFNIQKYGAKIDLSAKEIQMKNKTLNDFRVLAHTSSDVLYLDNIYFKAYDGELQTKGNISFFDELLYQLSFNTSGMESKKIIDDFFPYLGGMEGKFAATGSVILQGNSPKDLISSLQISSNILAPSMTINGFSSDDIVDLALKRVDINPSAVLDRINVLLNTGENEITNLTGNIQGKKGMLTTNNISFKTRFSQGVFGMSLDLNNFTFSSTTQMAFAPYVGNQIITYNFNKNGSLFNKLNATIDSNNLLSYVKAQYGIVTEEDLQNQQKLLQEQKRKLAEDPDNKDYLYYKLQQQLDASQNK